MDTNNMTQRIVIYSTVIPDLTRPSQPGVLLRRSRLGNPDAEKFLLDSRLRGNDREEDLQNYSLNHTTQAGLTLVEIVVAAFILIASLTVLLISFNRVKHNAETARRELKAMQVARTEIEQLRATNYSDIANYTNFFLELPGGRKQCTVTNINNSYTEISLTISWRSTVGTPTISQTFNTIICNTN